MSGIVGLFNLDGRPAALSEVEILSASSRHRAPDGQHLWISSCFGLGHQHARVTPESATEEQPLVSRSGIAIAFDGRLDNRQELAAYCARQASESPRVLSDAACVLGAYDHAGERFASHLNGDFALALFDPGRRQLLLARDVMAARRLHYTRLGNTLLFASEIKSLLSYPGISPVPDEDALADIVLDRWIEADCTGFKGIYSVPPGHTVVATRDKISLHEHWAFDPAREIRYRTFGEYVECFRELFEQSVLRRMRTTQPVAVSVSGGVDSSSIYCQALHLKRRQESLPPVCGISNTFPAGSPADEQEFLDVLDAACGQPITRLPLSSRQVLSHAGASIAQVEMPAFTWPPLDGVLEAAKRSGCSVMLNGYFGDQMLFPRGYLLDLAHRGRWRQLRHDLREFVPWNTDVEPGVFQQEFWSLLFRSFVPRPVFQAAKRNAARLRAARYPAWYTKAFVMRVIERQLARFPPARTSTSEHSAEYYRHVTAGHYLFQLQWQTAESLMHGLEAAYPFRDRDLVAFLMAIPGEVMCWHGVPKGLARQALTGILPPPVRDRRWKADFTAFINQAALHDYSMITRLLTRRSLAVTGGFVDGSVIESSILAHKTLLAEDDSAKTSGELGQLLALELWLQRFFGAGLPCTTS